MNRHRFHSFVLAIAWWPILAAASNSSGDAAPESRSEIPVQFELVVGRYDFVGRFPDRQRSYAGTAVIDQVGGHLRLTRHLAGKRTEVFGVLRRASPGEAWVLSFAWGSKPTMEMVCVIGTDLDNYARLTCHWGENGNPHKKPGIETYFSQEPWQVVD